MNNVKRGNNNNKKYDLEKNIFCVNEDLSGRSSPSIWSEKIPGFTDFLLKHNIKLDHFETEIDLEKIELDECKALSSRFYNKI
ncbi:hypothetical protein HZS_1036 [Henneguya salminicola]|nr:hypothetical protein HZS_1036 [Henneguya salminicola]